MGCADARVHSPDFEGEEVTSEVTGETVRRDAARRAARYALSIGVTLVASRCPSR